MMETRIPQPPGWPIIGNILDIDFANTDASFQKMKEIYGPVFKLQTAPGRPPTIYVCNREVLDEICEDERFVKIRQVEVFQKFETALAAACSLHFMGTMRDMFNEMYDISCQLVSQWARHGPKHKITVTDDFTRLALDTIALCCMDTRFNSFYREGIHPFVSAMSDFLQETFVTNYMHRASTQKYWDDVKVLRDVAESVISERRANPSPKNDLLGTMINGNDPETEQHMTDESIMDNMITFLIAGHETTSGLLSFVFFELINHQKALKKAQEEVDRVLGREKLTVEHLSKLPYISAIIRETLRLHSSAPALSVVPFSQDSAEFPLHFGQKNYRVERGENFLAMLSKVYRDQDVYGVDADEFKPERMFDEPFRNLPRNAWKPFGNGARGCIGRAFALQESHIIITLLLQNFDFQAYDPEYKLKIKKTLSVKPKDFFMHAKLRHGLDPVQIENQLWNGKGATMTLSKDNVAENIGVLSSKSTDRRPMNIYYGSNMGTCQTLAHALAGEARTHGFNATVDILDATIERLPKDLPIAIITASYEGEPPDNAGKFVKWLTGLDAGALTGVKYAVFGCGNREWTETFQKVPRIVDEHLERCGGGPIAMRCFSDAADNNVFNDFDLWSAQIFWLAVKEHFGVQEFKPLDTNGFDIEIITNSASIKFHGEAKQATVKANKLLTKASELEKRHIELELPSNMTYQVGDYLAILPTNPHKLVKRIMSYYELSLDSKIAMKAGASKNLPSDVTIYNLLSSYVELNQPATQKNIAFLADSISDPSESMALLALDPSEVLESRITVFDLLNSYPGATLSFGAYLGMLPPLRPRLYSISSSALQHPKSCSLTFSVLDTAPSVNRTHHLGAASTFLRDLEPGDRIGVSIQGGQAKFRLPTGKEAKTTPIVMACAGSGLAPFRGFTQERMAQLGTGKLLAPALLFIGCRHPDRDLLYEAEVKRWVSSGAVSVYYAFSQATGKSDSCGYVQDRMWKERKEVMGHFKKGGRIYVCGSKKICDGIGDVVTRAYEEIKGVGRQDAEDWFRKVRGTRFAVDVFA